MEKLKLELRPYDSFESTDTTMSYITENGLCGEWADQGMSNVDWVLILNVKHIWAWAEIGINLYKMHWYIKEHYW